MTAGLLWIEKVPVITGAPAGRSARVVKLTRPCRTCTICLLPLPLLLLLFVVVLIRVLPWIIPSGLWTIFGKMRSTAAVETSIITILTIELWGIRPWAKLLLLLLLRHWGSESSLLLRRPKDKSTHWGISLWRSGWSIL